MDKAMEVSRFLRQSDHLPESMRQIGINVIGVGAVGSFTCLSLCKMGFFSIRAWDPDIVSENNISNQFYRLDDVGRPKVEALKDMINQFEKVNIEVENVKYNGQSFLPGIVVSCLDSIEARQSVWKFIKNKPSVHRYIDTRMGLESLELITVNPLNREDQKYYETTIADPKDVEPLRCTARSILFTPLIMAGFVGSIITRIVRQEFDMIKRHVAFDASNIYSLQIS